MQKIFITALILLLSFAEEVRGEPNDPVYDRLVWYDEFDEDGALDNSKWFHQTLLPNGNNWFNGEIQHYTDRIENTYVENGIMYLVAKQENYTDQGVTKQHTSARLNSKFAFTYGRVEVKAKLPSGVGTWPAIWMLGKNINEKGAYWYTQGYGTTNWPACGEIDIMEHWGSNQNFIQSAMHTPSSFGGTVNHGGQTIPTASTEFHVYALDWYPDRMVFSVDGVVHYTYNPAVRDASTWPFDKEQYLLLNVAILPSIDPAFTESAMEIDYVRIYQESMVDATGPELNTKLTIAPNPVNSVTHIKSPPHALGSTVLIVSMQGEVIKTMTIHSEITLVDMSNWVPGAYLIRQQGTNINQTYKVIKQ
jgi:beta-glucanase (GH16 family)